MRRCPFDPATSVIIITLIIMIVTTTLTLMVFKKFDAITCTVELKGLKLSTHFLVAVTN